MHTPTYDKAKKNNLQVVEAARNLGDDVARDAWNALTGRGDTTELAEAITLTMPEDYFPLLRGNDGVPACFALRKLADVCLPGQSAFALRAACNNAWQQFEERRARANDVKEGLGWDLSDSWLTEREVDNPEVMDDIAAIARLAGRMYEHIKGQKIRATDGQPEEVETVTVGGELDRLIPSELAQLVDEDLGDATAIRVMQKRSLEFQFRGDKPAIRGPLVIVIDESGSMGSKQALRDAYQDYRHGRGGDPHGADHDGHLKAGRNRWAKACAAALTRVAHDEGRLVRIVHFGTVTMVQDLKVGDRKAMIKMMRTFLSGGNDINMALTRAIEEVGDLEDQGFKGADIVLVSDGVDHTDHKTPTETMKTKGIKLWSVSIQVKWEPEAPLVANAATYIHVDGKGLTDDAVKALKGAAVQETK